MTVNITLSETLGGYSMADTTDLGSVAAGASVGAQDIYITHDAEVNPITSCAIYLSRYSGSSYPGTDEDADFTQIMGWGDTGSAGVKLNMVSPFITGWAYFKNGYGDVNNQIPLDKDSVVVGTVPLVDGEIPVGGTAHVQINIDVPASPGSSGIKAFTMVFAYSATS